MKKNRIFTSVIFLMCGGFANATETPEIFLGRSIHEGAPPEVKHWGRLLGDWSIRWEAFDEDGAVTNNGEATWHWYSTLGGFAIQDFYTHSVQNNPSKNRVGTNLRIFDAEFEKWRIRWTHNYGHDYEAYTGFKDGDQIIVYKDGNESVSRIRFFEFSENKFRQQEEKSDDGGNTWRATYKAWATRIGS